MYLIGIQSVKPIIGDIEPASIAHASGLESGMQITQIGKHLTKDWQSVNLELVAHVGEPRVLVKVLLPGASTSVTRELDISRWEFDPDKASTLKSLGILPFRPDTTTELAVIAQSSPAERAGLRVGDKIVGIDGTKIDNWSQIVSYIGERPSSNIEVLVNREGTGETFQIETDSVESAGVMRGYLGVSPVVQPWPQEYVFNQQHGVIGAVVKAANETWRLITLSVQMIGKLFTGDISVKNLSGPISIAQGAGASASYGLVYFLSFLALISVNLGIVNLLPLPVLDGGHLLFYTIEMIMGKPVPEQVQEVGFRIGGALLFALMAVAIFNDIARL